MKQGLIIITIAIVLFGIFMYVPSLSQQGAVACTQEVKLCADGSAVGRTGPKCEFAQCPGESVWATFTDESIGLSFKFPTEFVAEYVSTNNWPPNIEVVKEQFECNTTGSEMTIEGKTEERKVNNSTYCRTIRSEGAAGSIYNTYTYTTEKDAHLLSFDFTLRFVQCANYDEPNKTACEKERGALDVDALIDRIVQTIEFK